MNVYTPCSVPTDLLVDSVKHVTFIGQFLRKFHIDELPNLINIAKGEMVFVGPRPALYNQSDLTKLRNTFGIHKMKPGITGLAQIKGRNGISNTQKVLLDEEYMFKKSFLFDIKIIIKTITIVLFCKCYENNF